MRGYRASAIGSVVAVLCSGVAFAGDGKVTAVRVDPGDPTSSIDRLSVKATVYVDSPRTGDQLQAMQQQLQGFARSMCDITDGLVSFDQIDFVNHPGEAYSADILWWQRPGRPVSGVGAFGKPNGDSCDTELRPDWAPGSSLNVYGVNSDLSLEGVLLTPAETLAHEMSHLLFGVGDSYADIRGGDYGYPRSSGFTGKRQLEFSPHSGRFFVNPASGAIFVDSSRVGEPETKLDGTPLYAGSVLASDGTDMWWLQNNSIMQQATRQVCRNSEGLAPNEVVPFWSNQACLRDADCSGYYTGTQDADGRYTMRDTDFGFCPTAGLVNNSELSVEGNADLDRFDVTRGDTDPAWSAATPVPHGQPGQELVFAGFLYPGAEGQPQPVIVDPMHAAKEVPECQEKDAAGNCLSVCDRFLDAASVSQLGSAPTPAGPVGVELQCASEFQAGGALCPGARAPASPNNPGAGATPDAQCDGCLLANLSACAPPLGSSSDPAIAGCGNGVLDHLQDPANPANTLFEQCDLGASPGYIMDPRLIGPSPLRCEDFFSLYRNQVLGQSSSLRTMRLVVRVGHHTRHGTVETTTRYAGS